jgi:hypothetical protein
VQAITCAVSVVAGCCKLVEILFRGHPFLGVSFRAFTASSTAKKGTPTAQLFDNRSIA